MSEQPNGKRFIASCSFGKDSLATVILAHEHKEPLDEIIYCEVMFSKEISGEVPEHRDFIYNTAIPKLEAWGYKVTVIRGDITYLDSFNHVLIKGKSEGKKRGFPSYRGCSINRDCKTRPIDRYWKSQSDTEIVQYIGIAIDEPERLKKLEGTNCTSLLAKYNYTESMAKKLCEKYGLFSPIYEFARRNGCWFCPNAGPKELKHLYQNHRELAEWLIKLEHSENLQPRGGIFNREGTPTQAFEPFYWEAAQMTIFDFLEMEAKP